MQISVDDPLRADVLLLLEEHLADMRATSPPESVHALDPAELVGPGADLLDAARRRRRCSGVRRSRSSMPGTPRSSRCVRRPAARRRGVASRLLDHVLDAARERGYQRLSLETGTQDFFAAGPRALRVPGVRRVRAVRVVRPRSAQRVLLKTLG